MRKNRSKVSMVIGLILAAVILGFTITRREEFLKAEAGIWILTGTCAAILLTIVFSIWEPVLGGRKKTVCGVLLFFLIPLITECGVELMNGNLLADIPDPGNVFMNYLIYLIVYAGLYGITGRIRIASDIFCPLMFVFGAANMYVKEFKGNPLLPWDLRFMKTAFHVAGTFEYKIGYEIIFAAAAAVCLMRLSSHIHHEKESHTGILRVLCLALFASTSGFYYMTDTVAKELGATPDFFNQTRGYEQKGAFAEFIVNTKYMSLDEPDGYDAERVFSDVMDIVNAEHPSILETVMKKQGSSEEEIAAALNRKTPENPDVIVIMNESWSDLSVIGDFTTNEPYMPYVDSLKGAENVIEGNSYVSTIGTGTSNTEYEFLTGNSMAFLPIGSNAYQLYVDHTQPGYASIMKTLGYSADNLHPYYRSSWNREAVYNYMGFDRFISIENLSNVRMLRRFASDEYDFEQIIRLYEERDPEVPFFLFNITMQNHSSYEKPYTNFTQEIELTGLEGEYPETDQYLSLVKATDDAFRDLIAYFEKSERPVIILMFGDHQPFIENGFYEEVMGEKLSSMSDETGQKRYITRFIIWANYDIPEAWVDEISVNYLSVLFSEAAGIPLTPYQSFLQSAYGEIPVITALGCRDSKGNYFTQSEKTEHDGLMSVLRNAAYNNLREDKNRADALFSIE